MTTGHEACVPPAILIPEGSFLTRTKPDGTSSRFSVDDRFQKFDHGPAHGFDRVHAGLCISVVMAAGTASYRERRAVNGGDVALELEVLAGSAVDREHGIKDHPSVVSGALPGLAKRGADELRVGCIEVVTQLFDQMNTFFLLSAVNRGTTAVPIALPPKEAHNLENLAEDVTIPVPLIGFDERKQVAVRHIKGPVFPKNEGRSVGVFTDAHSLDPANGIQSPRLQVGYDQFADLLDGMVS